MATHSSIYAWKIPWTEEPGELWSMGLCRVGHKTAHTHDAQKSYRDYMHTYRHILSLSQLPQLRYSESATYEPLLLTHTHTHTPFSELKGKNPCIQI